MKIEIAEKRMNYSELFERILEKPAMYVGRPSITHIRSFMTGYAAGQWDLGVRVKEDPYYEFQKFVENRYHNLHPTHSWDSIISFYYPSEQGSFERLKELWKEFRSELVSKCDEAQAE